MDDLVRIQRDELQKLAGVRDGEVRVGDRIEIADAHLPLSGVLHQAKERGCSHVIVGVPEDIGVRANGGRAGAALAWNAFLQEFLRQQANRFSDPSKYLLLGVVRCDDLMEKATGVEDIALLRSLVDSLDMRVEQILSPLFASGLTPIIIGGGHNNAYPLLKARAKRTNVINIDAHADFRPLEGRHSGNGFRYAYQEELLSRYMPVGLQLRYCSEEQLDAMEQAGFPFMSFELMREQDFAASSCLATILEYFPTDEPLGIEVDLDVIANMPSSAMNPVGLTANFVSQLLVSLFSLYTPAYLHITEGAPELSSGPSGGRVVGRTIAELIP